MPETRLASAQIIFLGLKQTRTQHIPFHNQLSTLPGSREGKAQGFIGIYPSRYGPRRRCKECCDDPFRLG